MHVDQLGCEVRVERARGDPKMHERHAGHLDGLGERIRLEGEHIRTLRQTRVRRLRPVEFRRLTLIGRTRCEQVVQPKYRVEEPRPCLLHARTVIRKLAVRAVCTADRRHRPCGVEHVTPRLGGRTRPRAGEASVPVEVERRRYRTCEQPFPFLTPLSAVVELALSGLAAGAPSHHEEPDRRLAGRVPGGVVRQPAREVVEMLLKVPLHPPDALWSEVHLVVGRDLPAHPHVTPRAEHEPLRIGVLRGHGRRVVGVRSSPRVEPPRRNCHGNIGVTVEVRGVVALYAGPPRVVCAARRVVDQRLLERQHVPERHLTALPRGRPEELPQIAHVVPDVLLLAGIVRDLLRVLRVDEERPEHLPLHRAALARAVRVVARRDDVRPDRGEVRRPFDRRANLHLPGVGAADGTDPAIRPRLLRDPLHHVVPIAARVWRSGMEVGAGAL